jgi:hypothetical protein
VWSQLHIFNLTISKQFYMSVTVLPEDDPAGLKHVGGSNINSEYNSTHRAFSWWFVTFMWNNARTWSILSMHAFFNYAEHVRIAWLLVNVFFLNLNSFLPCSCITCDTYGTLINGTEHSSVLLLRDYIVELKALGTHCRQYATERRSEKRLVGTSQWFVRVIMSNLSD